MARRHMRFIETAALAGLLMSAAPLAAQSTNETTPPPPAADAVGPPQLRDFNLNGAATQPVQPATPTPAPIAPQQPSPSAPAAGTAPPTEPRAAPALAPARTAPAPAQRRPTIAAPDRDPARDAVTVDLPPPSAAPIVPAPSFAPAPPPVPEAEAPLGADDPGTAWWPWIGALLALALGAAFLWCRTRRDKRELYAADGADLGAALAAPAAPPVPLPRAAATPPVSPRSTPHSPAQAPARPLPSAPQAPAPAATAAATPAAAPAPAPPPAPPSGGIVASGLKPRIEFDLVPIRAETDGEQGAALTVDIIVINRGSAPARDVLVEAQLINAGPQVDAEVGRFFVRPAGSGERIPVIPPMQSVAIKIRLEVLGANISPLVVEGRKLLVPLVAVNAFYRWSGSELSESSSFLVGRGDAEGGKMAPFRLDQGARSWSGLGARLHSSGLQR